MKVVLLTYKSIGWLTKAYGQLHEKYWNAPVTLVAEEDYSEGQFEFVRPPDDGVIRWEHGEILAGNFSDVLAWYLGTIHEDLVLIMFSDYLIRGPVDVARLALLEEYMLSHPEVLRGHVGLDGGFCNGSQVDRYRDLDIYEGNFLPVSLAPGLWNRKLLRGMLTPGQGPWWVELLGRDKFPWNGCRSIATPVGMIPYVNSLRGRDMGKIVLTRALDEEIGALVPSTFQKEYQND